MYSLPPALHAIIIEQKDNGFVSLFFSFHLCREGKEKLLSSVPHLDCQMPQSRLLVFILPCDMPNADL